jgi:hypothetical protein
MTRLDIDRGISRTVDTGLVAAEFGEPLQIRDNAPSVDARHGPVLSAAVAISARIA